MESHGRDWREGGKSLYIDTGYINTHIDKQTNNKKDKVHRITDRLNC